jgi:hypothetical protein
MPLKKIRTMTGVISIAFLVLLTASCGNEPDTPAPRPAPEDSGSFTFFNIGKNSIINKKTGKDLEKILGDAAVERRGILNLAINYKDFLKDHFPELDRMNRRLNSSIGLRVEHRVVKRMYRYAGQKGLPYDLVEFLSSEKSEKPILIRLHFKTNGSDTLKTLERKYGPPRTLAWGREKATSRSWQKEGDYLFYSIVPKRGNKVEYRIDIYYTAAIEALIQSERSGQRSETSGKTGF